MCCENWAIFFHQQIKNSETKQIKHFAQQWEELALQFMEQEQADVLQPEDAIAAMKHFCNCETCKRDLRKVEQYERKA